MYSYIDDTTVIKEYTTLIRLCTLVFSFRHFLTDVNKPSQFQLEYLIHIYENCNNLNPLTYRSLILDILRIMSDDEYIMNLSNTIEHEAYDFYDYNKKCFITDKCGRYVRLYIYFGDVSLTIDDISDSFIVSKEYFNFNTVARFTDISNGPHDGDVNKPIFLYTHDFDHLLNGSFKLIEPYMLNEFTRYNFPKRSYMHRSLSLLIWKIFNEGHGYRTITIKVKRFNEAELSNYFRQGLLQYYKNPPADINDNDTRMSFEYVLRANDCTKEIFDGLTLHESFKIIFEPFVYIFE